MAGRGTVNRVVQVGKETTPGTGVPANKKLPLTSIVLSRSLDVKQFRAQGFKIPGGTKVNKDFGTGKVSGPLNWTEMVYLLATLVTPVITTPGGATLARQWLFTVLGSGEDAFTTLTIQEGDGTAATQMVYSLLTELGIDVKLDDAQINGTLLGRSPAAASLTGSPTVIAQLPAGPRDIDVYMDAEGGTIGTTAVTDALSYSFQVQNKQAAKWVLSTSQTSFKETVETVPTIGGSIETEHNAQSRALYAAVISAANPVKLFRLKVTGPLIEGIINYSFQLDFAAQVTAMEQSDVDGVWGYKYTLLPVYSPTFGNKSFEITIITTLTAL